MWREKIWSKGYFSDESKFNLFGSDEKHYVQFQTGEKLKPLIFQLMSDRCNPPKLKLLYYFVLKWLLFSNFDHSVFHKLKFFCSCLNALVILSNMLAEQWYTYPANIPLSFEQ